jgi:aerobic-type carbon monoxide dehydrogenase small subunit (CoxS/CutS family)
MENTLGINRNFMDVLDEIVDKDVKSLTEDEKAFLVARCYYLTTGQLNKFSSILDKPTEPIEEEIKPRIEKKTKDKLN